jgi:hypothetical protein
MPGTVTRAAAVAMFALAANVSSAQAPRTDTVDALARDVGRLESLRAVKNVQRSYAQYAQFGLWTDMAALFADNGKIVWGDQVVVGPAAIARWLKGHDAPAANPGRSTRN